MVVVAVRTAKDAFAIVDGGDARDYATTGTCSFASSILTLTRVTFSFSRTLCPPTACSGRVGQRL